MKVCTFSVNSINARMELILEWLKHRENDIEILCFQKLIACKFVCCDEELKLNKQ